MWPFATFLAESIGGRGGWVYTDSAMNIYVRLANMDDIPAMLGFDQLAQQPGSGRENFIRGAVADRTAWVATLPGQVVGYGVLEYTFFACGFISMVYVHQAYRRCGVGQALLDGLEKACQTPKLFTSTNLSNLPMRALLTKRGYVESGIIHNLDEGDPEVVYFKRVE